ncbi:SDR family NAD(P)-dependent oxidoreductase [Myxococcus sp. K15C18031901]|uniref:type I polyketide synthase n=1 Tax=Myxococcus dinghuensis TaxID=2906761 RepID=UPI0020A82BC8|nr:type I polyketide synthase [Myxococcus dinghuensis]MCP3098452.1 SDR family NAD(P)-dependent oxidoreductase [Myxococcus dinghuensis]
MKPSFRLLQTLLRGRARGPLDPLAEGVTRWRVLPTDLDLFGHMNNSRYLAMMDLGRVDLLVRAGLLPAMLRQRWVAPVGETSLQFRDALRLFEHYELGTRLAAWDDHWLYFEQQFRRVSEPERPVATGLVRAVFRDAHGPVPPPRVIQHALGREVRSPAPSESLRRHFGLDRGLVAPPTESSSREPLAIVGIGCRLPGGVEDAEGLWQVLMEGRECIVDIPESRWDARKFHDATGRAPGRTYAGRAGLLQQDLRAFEPGFFGITPREAAALDPQQRLLLEVSWEALEDAGVPPTTLAGSRTGVFVGGFMMDNLILHASPDNREQLDTHSPTASTLTMLSNRLSYFYDLRGPSVSMDTACSSSLVALHMACQSLWAQESEAALVGGVNVLLLPETQVTMSKGRFLSPRGRCHAFSDQADGYVRAEGAAILVIKPLSAALRDGNPIHSLILGTAVNQDGRTPGITVPNAEAQVAVMREAYAKAGVDPLRVAYVEAHGTGTPVGDPIEARAIGTVTGVGREGAARCRMGSLKTNLGHLEAAAGVTGVIKAALVLRHGVVPPHLHLEKVNPQIPLDALGLHIPTRPEALPRGDGPLLAGVNSFGYGGTNAHVVLAEPPRATTSMRVKRPEGRPHLLPLSARSPEALTALAGQYADGLESGRGTPEALCRDAAVHRSHPRHRLTVRGPNREALAASLRAFARGEHNVAGLDFVAEPPEARKLLFVYTGMGPQWWAMGRQLHATEPVFRDAVAECDAHFRELSGWSIAAELQRDATTSRITRTEVAQPANAVLQVALTRLWASWGIIPDAVLGHSIGEVGAAWASGALDLRDMLLTAFHRSRLQQRIAGQGGMLAVGLGPDEAREWVARHGPDIAVAAVNSERAVTLAGGRASLERVASELAAQGRFQRFLQVEVPYHSPLMEPLRDELLASLTPLRPHAPRLPIYSTVSGRRMTDAERHDAPYWWNNVRGSVLFADALHQALGDGHGTFVEVGPHPVLATFIRDVLGAARARGEVIASLVRETPEQETMAAALGKLHAVGMTPAWRAFFGPGTYQGAPRTPWQRQSHWEESPRSHRRRRAFEGHPMFVDAEAGVSPTWTAELSLAALPYLGDHHVAGSLLFPGAGHVELALAARHALTGDASCCIEELELSSAILLREDTNVRVRIGLSSDSAAFHVQQVDEAQVPVVRARGKLFSAGRVTRTQDLSALRTRISHRVDVTELYAALERRGLRYGPTFRAVTALHRTPDEVLAHVTLPGPLDDQGYHLHPVLLDAAFHSLLASASDDAEHDVVPVGIDRILVLGPAGRSLFAHGRLLDSRAGTVRGDITLLGEDGGVIAEITGFTARLLPRALPHAKASIESAVYVRRWERFEPSAPDSEDVSWVVLGGPTPEPRPRGWHHVDALAELEPLLAGMRPGGRVRLVDLRWAEPARTSTAPLEAGTQAAESLLRTVQALRSGQLDRYFLVTTRAEAVGATSETPSLEHAPMLGLARTAMTERPDLHLTWVDLEASPGDMGGLLALLRGVGPEQEVALRGEVLHASRLVRGTLAPAPAQPQLPPLGPVPEGMGYELAPGEAGRLDTLGFVARARRTPGAGEVELEVESTALGFKDVMKALGLLSERAKQHTFLGDAIGMEGAGRISAVGAGVTDFAVGDRVYGVAPGFLASHVVLPSSQVVKLPPHLTFEQGANLVVFLTVYHALVKVARLRPGERVLVHGATGGVGLAAIEVARWCGAEVIATAGTEEKRRYLREQGVSLVSHSRDVGFVEDVRAWTNGRGVDVVLNFMPGEIMARSLSCLAPFGRFIELGKASFEQDELLRLRPFHENLTYAAVDFDRLLGSRPEEVRALYQEVLRRFEDGSFRPLPSRSWPASQVEEAFRTMARGQHIGKVCITLKDPDLRVRRPEEQGTLTAEATYLVTGGLGGFGLEVARWLVERGARHLVLVSRRGASSEEAREALAAWTAQGVQVHARSADISRAEDVARILTQVRDTLPPLRGVFHCAVVLDDKPLARMDRASLDKVMAAKAQGAWNLHQETRGTPLDFFVLFSSISSLIGNAGQGNYVAANAFLDQLAVHRRRQGLAATAIQWGALGEAGLVARNAGVAQHLEHLGLSALSTAMALQALEHILASGPEQVAVADVDWGRLGAGLAPGSGARRLAALLEAPGQPTRASEEAALVERTFGRLDDEARRGLVTKTLTRVVARVMRTREEALDAAQPLRELGMDSIMALEIVTAVEGELGVKLSSMEVVSGPSIRELTTVLLGHILRAQGVTPLPDQRAA